MTYAARLSRELLHTPRREWPSLITRRVFEACAKVYCVYCGNVTDGSGMSVDQLNAAMLDHQLSCEKRPEKKFVQVYLAAAEVLEKFRCQMDDAWSDEFGRAMAKLEAALVIPSEGSEHGFLCPVNKCGFSSLDSEAVTDHLKSFHCYPEEDAVISTPAARILGR